MLTSGILNFFFDIIIKLLSGLNDVSSTSMFVSGTANATHYFSTIASILPLTMGGLIAILLAFVVIEVAYLGYKIVYWLIKRIPTQS